MRPSGRSSRPIAVLARPRRMVRLQQGRRPSRQPRSPRRRRRPDEGLAHPHADEGRPDPGDGRHQRACRRHDPHERNRHARRPADGARLFAGHAVASQAISARLGQRVKKGDSLALIESPDIGNAVADLHKAQADLIAASHDLKRKKELFEEKAGSGAELEAAQDTYRRAKAEVERAEEKDAAPAHRQRRRRDPDLLASLVAPVDGEVLMRNISPGIEVQGQYSGGAGTTACRGSARPWRAASSSRSESSTTSG